jgi:hypothetical protein
VFPWVLTRNVTLGRRRLGLLIAVLALAGGTSGEACASVAASGGLLGPIDYTACKTLNNKIGNRRLETLVNFRFTHHNDVEVFSTGSDSVRAPRTCNLYGRATGHGNSKVEMLTVIHNASRDYDGATPAKDFHTCVSDGHLRQVHLSREVQTTISTWGWSSTREVDMCILWDHAAFTYIGIEWSPLSKSMTETAAIQVFHALLASR